MARRLSRPISRLFAGTSRRHRGNGPRAIRSSADPVDRARWRIVLAMGLHHLGREQAARESDRRARSELAEAKLSPSAAEEFARLRSEAEATLNAPPVPLSAPSSGDNGTGHGSEAR
jgi:hypothetical protein